MEILPDTIGTIDKSYCILRKVGCGGTAKVYIGYNKNDVNKTIFAIKVINPQKHDSKYFKNEVEMLKQVEHKNVVKLIDGAEGMFEKCDGRSKFVYYIVLEYIKNGELFDFIFFPKSGFGEDCSRLIFLSILDGMDAIHKAGVVHRDLKTENIMVSEDFTVKIADFGFAAVKEGRDGQGLLYTWLGTPNYAAPELHSKTPYYGICNDIFAMAVTLFVITTGAMPFKQATPQDAHYHYIFKNDYQGYWKKRGLKLSPAFMDLFNNLVANDHTQRPTIDEIKSHPWILEANFDYNGKLIKEFQDRLKIVTEKRNKASIQKAPQNNTNIQIKAYKSGEGFFPCEKIGDDKNLEKYVDCGNRYVAFLSGDSDLSSILNLVKDFFNEKKAILEECKKPKPNCLKFELPSEQDESTISSFENDLINIEQLKITVDVKKLEDGRFAVEFNKRSGDRYRLFNLYEEFLTFSTK
jgi:serine/threonine protein kinase